MPSTSRRTSTPSSECTFSRSSSATAGGTPCSSWSSDRMRPSIDRGRRRLAEVVADRAEHHRHLARDGRDRRCGARAWSMTSSVWTQTSPSGCHSGSCGQPTSASSSGNSRSITPSSSASAKPIEGRAARSSSFSISPQIRSAGRSSSGIAPAERLRRRIERRARSAPRTAARAARAGCRRRRCRASTARSVRRVEVARARRTDRGSRRSADPTRSR